MKKHFLMRLIILIIPLLLTQTSVTSADNGFDTITKVSYLVKNVSICKSFIDTKERKENKNETTE